MKLTHLDFKALAPHLVTARIITHTENQSIEDTVESSKAACHVLGKISTSLLVGIADMFDEFLSILANCNLLINRRLAEQMRRDLFNTTTGIV